MPFVFLVAWLVFVAAFGITQFRFHSAHIKRYGGPTYGQRIRMSYTHPIEYLRLMLNPPFSLSAMWRPVDDPGVERLRRQYLLVAKASLGYLVALFVGALIYGVLFVW